MSDESDDFNGIGWLVKHFLKDNSMYRNSLLSRSALALTLTTALAVGMTSFVSPAFGCGTNAGAGSCKQAGHEPGTRTDVWPVLEAVLTGLRIVIRF